MSQLAGWENFYIIVGPSAGALIGLTFVAVSLIGEGRVRGAQLGVAAYNTPTVMHFGVALFVSALLSAPWTSLVAPAVILGVCGLAGVIYTIVVALRQRKMGRVTGYFPVFEDWLWYVAAPLIAYAALVPSALLLPGNTATALFTLGAVMLLLLFLGIHNAWDLVTYIAIEHPAPQNEQSKSKVETDRGN